MIYNKLIFVMNRYTPTPTPASPQPFSASLLREDNFSLLCLLPK